MLADDSHEISYLIFFPKIRKDVANFVVCCALRVISLYAGVFHDFFSSADFFFSKSIFSKMCFWNTIRVSNVLQKFNQQTTKVAACKGKN